MFGQKYAIEKSKNEILEEAKANLETQVEKLSDENEKLNQSKKSLEERIQLLEQRLKTSDELTALNTKTINDLQQQITYAAQKQSLLMTENNNNKEKLHHILTGLEEYITKVYKVTGTLPAVESVTTAKNEAVSV